MHAVLVVQSHPSCRPILLTLYEVARDKDLGDGWIFGALDVAHGPHFDPTFAIPLSSVKCMAFASDPAKLSAQGPRLLELNRKMTGSRGPDEYTATAEWQAQRELHEVADMVQKTRDVLHAHDGEALPDAADRVVRTWRLELANCIANSEEAEKAAQAERTAAERERSDLLHLVADLRRAMATWANDEDGVPEHAADAFDRASRLLELPESREDC